MFRLLATIPLLLAMAGAPVLAAGDLERQVQEIEGLSTTAPWQASDEKIKALSGRFDQLTAEQRNRLEYVRLRNLGFTGSDAAALRGFATLLQQPLPAVLRLRAYGTAISIAANVENWSLAFTWLNEAMARLPEASGESARLLGVASYLYTLVGENDKGLQFALRGLHQAEAGGDGDLLCRALADVALAEDHANNFRVAQDWRHRQIEACTRVGDRVFVANGQYGVGKMAAGQGRYDEALQWARRALAEMETIGFTAGAYSARLVIAESLIGTGRDLAEADALLADTLAYYRGQSADVSIAETENLLARLAERRGNVTASLAHLKAAAVASAAAERGARERQLAYLQVQFDTQSKEQQITLLETEKQLAEAQATANQRRQLLLALGLAGLLVTAVLLSILLRRSARDRRRYRWQSEHDSLTRLYNYQHVRKLGEPALARAQASGRPFTAVAIDIDLFKQVNDRHGHAAGDAALRALGGWISEATDGGGAIAGRSGGDEFTVLLEGDVASADAMLQRLRERIVPITVFGRAFQFSISAGVCQANAGAMTLEQLIHEADQALYRAKHEGRDRVVCAKDETATSGVTSGLAIVGGGMLFGRHASERYLAEIRSAQVVFCLADPFTLAMLGALRPDVVNLASHFVPGKDRHEARRDVEAVIMQEVRAARQVCVVFLGHPGVCAEISGEIARNARAEGFPVRMEPGISAETCLREDLGFDLGEGRAQSMEATRFLFHDHQPDPAGLLLLWQTAPAHPAGDRQQQAERAGLQALVDKLLRWYPPTHEVILFAVPQLAIDEPRVEHLMLRDLPTARFDEYTMLVVPPLNGPAVDDADLRRRSASPA